MHVTPWLVAGKVAACDKLECRMAARFCHVISIPTGMLVLPPNQMPSARRRLIRMAKMARGGSLRTSKYSTLHLTTCLQLSSRCSSRVGGGTAKTGWQHRALGRDLWFEMHCRARVRFFFPGIADQGHGFMPSYVYRQLYEWYHKADW